MTSPENAISLAVETRIDELCDQFEATWCSASPRTIEELLETFESEPDRSELLRRLLEVELELLAGSDMLPVEADYQRRFPNHETIITGVFRQFLASQLQNEANRGAESTIDLAAAETSHVQSQPATTPTMPTNIGRFELIEELGRGGFGTVYRARDPKVGRDVAIKVPSANRFTTADASRFLREARAAATLRHANVCAVHDVGEEDGHAFIVMDYIAGEPLSAMIKRDERLPAERISQIVRELALALECVHHEGITHRDLKPANVIIDKNGTPIIMDFGLARLSEADDNSITHGGDILGTPAYMPLEQARGDVTAIGPTSDVYSLGAILYEMLCGQRPYRGSSGEIIGQIQHAAPPPPSTHDPRVNRELEAVCLKAMARKPRQRYQSMSEFAEALSAVSLDSNINRRCTYRRTGWGAAALSFIALAAAITYVQTDNGWLQIESEEDVRLVVSQAGREVTIIDTQTQSQVRLHSGEYEIKLRGDRNDVKLSKSRFSMTRGDCEVVSIENLPAASQPKTGQNGNAAESEVVPAVAQPAASEISRRAVEPEQEELQGQWKLDGEELLQDKVGKAFLMFGDSRWTDYDVQVEMFTLPGLPDTQGGGIDFRATSTDDHYSFSVGNFGGEAMDLTKMVQGVWERVGHYQRVPLILEHWYCLRIEVRGSSLRCFADGIEIFNCTDSSFSSGAIALATWNSRVRWRNLSVTDPNGKLLWEGFPDVSRWPLDHQLLPPPLPQFSEVPVIEAGELCGSATPDKHFEIRLGDFEWRDYDVHVEYLRTGGESFLWLKSNPEGNRRWDLSLGGWGPTNVDLRAVVDGEPWWTSPARRWCPEVLSGRMDKWHALEIRLRETRIMVRLDDREVTSSQHPQITKGCIGMAFTDGRWRNLEVRTPDGKLLWKDWPAAGSPSTESNQE